MISKAVTPHLEVIEITKVHDVKAWMMPYVPPLHDHLKAHQFKFEKDCNGIPKMFYKEWSCDKFWLPQSGINMLIGTRYITDYYYWKYCYHLFIPV